MLLLHILYLAIAAISLLIALIYQIQYLQYLWKQIFRPREQRQLRGRVSRSYRTDKRNRELQSKLIGLLRGDTPTAKRLLKHQRQLNPGNSDNWYLEKVIHDLERDRRC